MKKFTLYAGQYIDVNGHNFVGLNAINRDENSILLHQGCSCWEGAYVVAECDEAMGPDDFGVTARFEIGVDDDNVAYCTMTFEGPTTESMRRMEEEGVTYQ